MASLLARLIRRSPALVCAYYLLDDWRARRRLAQGDLATRSGMRHVGLDLDASVAYVERVAADYLAGAGRERFTGRIAEIGPGDSRGVALAMLALGGGEVHTVDRYRTTRDPENEARIERAIVARHGPDAKADRVIEHAGAPAETFFRATALSFDWIVSRDTLEHLYDPIGALDGMFGRLKPGGVMVHRIDFRDHGMFAGHHPLTLLTVPAPLHRAMTRGSGRPNRVLAPEYRAWLARAGAEGTVLVTRLVGEDGEIGPAPWPKLDARAGARALGLAAAIRPRLAYPFRELADEDLATAGVELVAHKP